MPMKVAHQYNNKASFLVLSLEMGAMCCMVFVLDLGMQSAVIIM